MMPPELSTRIVSPLLPALESWLDTQFDTKSGALWLSLQAQSRRIHNLSPQLLARFQDVVEQAGKRDPHWHDGDTERPVHYAVLRSDHPADFNLGTDLAYLLNCLDRGENAALQRYSMQLLDTVHQWSTAWTQNATTISLVQGRALGAGFEMALAAHYLVAEEHAVFGFPEILYGLFPGHGAMSLLNRRIGLGDAERMMRSGRLYGAAELMEMGIVDQVCPSGRGEAAVREFIQEHAQRRMARLAVQRARLRMQPLDHTELAYMARSWSDTAARLDGEQRRMLRGLLRMQRSDSSH